MTINSDFNQDYSIDTENSLIKFDVNDLELLNGK